MSYLEVRNINGKKYYYRTKSVRKGEKVGKEREYLGSNLSKKELDFMAGKSKKKKSRINEFFNINKFPNEEGILVFGISMNKIGNEQSARNCFKYMENFIPKIIKPTVGLNTIYGDNLYLYSKERADKLKKKHQSLVNSHKNEFLKLLNTNKWYIQKSFSFTTWSQMILESKDFPNLLGQLQKTYKKDKEFQKWIKKDIKISNKEINENSINFILEEILLFYLVSKGKIKLYNEYVGNKEKWILWCYPGKPLYSEIYLYQQNPFNLNNPKNKYENSFYDLKAKKLYNYDNIDLENLKL